jgi:hypothetical protein
MCIRKRIRREKKQIERKQKDTKQLKRERQKVKNGGSREAMGIK